MSKELVIASSPHETKVAVLEDDQLVEVYYERDTHAGLVGGIYKGRVSRVLPGMQSAFVDIGLDRDAFLYVSDFFEDAEEYDKIVAEAEARVTRYTESASPSGGGTPGAETAPLGGTHPTTAETPPPEAASLPAPAGIIVNGVEQQPPVAQPVPVAAPSPAAPESSGTAIPPSAPPIAHPHERPQGQHQDFRRGEPRGRRRRRHGRQFDDRKFGPKPEFRDRPAERHSAPEPSPTHTFEVLPGESLAKHKQISTQAADQSAPSRLAGPAEDQAPIPPGRDEALQPESVPVDTEATEVKLTVESEPQLSSSPQAPPVGPSHLESEAPQVNESAEPVSDQRLEPLASSEPSDTAAVERVEAGGTHPDELGSPATATAEGGATAASTSESKSTASEEISPPPSAEFGTPAVDIGNPLVTQPQTESKPRPLWDRLVSTVLGKPHEIPASEIPASAEAPVSEPAHGMEATGPEIAQPTAETTEPEAASEPEATAPEASTPAGSAPTEPGATTPEAPPDDQTATPPVREYTLREPHQRPRFAPRKRGRFSRGSRDSGLPGQSPRREPPRAGNNQPVQIAEVLKEGQEILVQIAKEPLGRKGARITSHIALPGRYLVYMPTVDHIGVSRKIASEDERLRLKNIIQDHRGSVTGGFIVRTAGAGRPEEELKADMKFLSTLWSDIRADAERTKAPALLHRDLDLMQRILRDILSHDFKCVRVDSEIEYERAVEFVNRCQPSLVGHVKLYTRDTPIFEELGVQAEIDKALKSKVWLKSGGYIVINQTEALVAIDVNTGKYVGKTNRLEDTIVKTNIDAVKEIVRQIRLRDLGGIIVIDFIDMDERRNRNKVVQALEEALRLDRAPTKILSFNDFGLVAITRKRVKQSLERTLCEPCAYCSGSGWIKSVTTVCYEILAEARKMAAEHESNTLTLRVHPDVAKALKSREGIVLSELESITRKDVIVKSDSNVHQERFEIY